MRKLIVLLLFISLATGLHAQEKTPIKESDYANAKVEMADRFRAEGKIYVLTGIICLIFAGIVVYLIFIDKKISRLEKQLPNHDNKKPF